MPKPKDYKKIDTKIVLVYPNNMMVMQIPFGVRKKLENPERNFKISREKALKTITILNQYSKAF